jgi:chromate transporter
MPRGEADASTAARDLSRVGRRPTGSSGGRTPLRDIAALFLTLGTIAFGGPAVHIAMMEEQVVRRRGWLTREQFLDYLGATNLIPGPNSTELAIHIGHARAGWPGLLVAGTAFILPAFLIVAGLGWAYVRFGALPEAAGLLYGVKPVVIAIVAQALWNLGRSAIKSSGLGLLAIAAIVAAACGVHELLVLAASGLLAVFVERGRGRRRGAVAALLGGVGWSESLSAASAAIAGAPVALWPLFAVFAKAGAVLFGSGYVLLAFLRADLVDRLGWLTEGQLLDAVAVGQVTPGPVFTTATFVGYVLAGPIGAVVATVGIFLPAFVFVALSGPIVPRLRRSRIAGAVLDGVNVASVALMAVVSWQLARAALIDPLTIGLAVASAIALRYRRLNPAWLIVLGAMVGWARSS